MSIKRASVDFDSSNRIRHKFRRWKLNILPGHIAGRVTRALLIIASRCRPCVLAAVWRTMWNGWPTSARMRSMAGNGEGTCALGCRTVADRIEHYAVCPVLWHFFAAPAPIGLGLVRQLQSHEGFLCIAHEMSDSEEHKWQLACMLPPGLCTHAKMRSLQTPGSCCVYTQSLDANA